MPQETEGRKSLQELNLLDDFSSTLENTVIPLAIIVRRFPDCIWETGAKR